GCLVRALPFIHVKSAKLNGSAFFGLVSAAVAASELPFATAEDGETAGSAMVAAPGAAVPGAREAAAARSVTLVVRATSDEGALAATGAGVADELLPSNSATRFSSCSTLSSSQRSRSVNPGFAASSLVGSVDFGSSVFGSLSAKTELAARLMENALRNNNSR